MIPNPLDLLKALASGIRPDGAAPPPTPRGVDNAGFADLLAKVREGSLSSGRAPAATPSSGVTLTPDQILRLGVALDAAEAAGHDRVVALIDGRALVADVASRAVTAEIDPASAGMLSGIDAVVAVPHGTESQLKSLFAGGASPRPAPDALAGLGTVRNPSLAGLLSPAESSESSNRSTGAAA